MNSNTNGQEWGCLILIQNYLHSPTQLGLDPVFLQVPVSSLFSPIYLGDNNSPILVIDKIDNSIIADANAIKRFRQFFAAYGSRGFLEVMDGF